MRTSIIIIIYCIFLRRRRRSNTLSIFIYFIPFFFNSDRSVQHIHYYFAKNMAARGLCIDLVFLIKSIIAYYSNFEMGACEMNQKIKGLI